MLSRCRRTHTCTTTMAAQGTRNKVSFQQIECIARNTKSMEKECRGGRRSNRRGIIYFICIRFDCNSKLFSRFLQVHKHFTDGCSRRNGISVTVSLDIGTVSRNGCRRNGAKEMNREQFKKEIIMINNNNNRSRRATVSTDGKEKLNSNSKLAKTAVPEYAFVGEKVSSWNGYNTFK